MLCLTCKITTAHSQVCHLWPFASKQREQKEQQTRHHHGHLAFQPPCWATPGSWASAPQALQVPVDSIQLPKITQHIKCTWRLLLHKSIFPTINKGDCTENGVEHRSSPETVGILQGRGTGEHHCLYPLSTSPGWMGALSRHSGLQGCGSVFLDTHTLSPFWPQTKGASRIKQPMHLDSLPEAILAQ